MTDDLEAILTRTAATISSEGAALAAEALASRAAAEGLLDIAYASIDSPVGPLLGAVTAAGLVRLAYAELVGGEDAVLAELARRVSPRVLAAPARLDAVRRQLDEYFAGTRRRFELAVDLRLTRGFSRRVLAATAAVEYGGVTTYTDVARSAGSERAARAAGNALGANPIPIVVPCHRVLHRGGGLGGYGGGVERKAFLLHLEGAPVAGGRGS